MGHVRTMRIEPQRQVVIGIALSPRWISTLERAAELLRQRQPGIDDATLMEKLFVYGLVAVIDGENNSQCPRNGTDDVLVARAEALL